MFGACGKGASTSAAAAAMPSGLANAGDGAGCSTNSTARGWAMLRGSAASGDAARPCADRRRFRRCGGGDRRVGGLRADAAVRTGRTRRRARPRKGALQGRGAALRPWQLQGARRGLCGAARAAAGDFEGARAARVAGGHPRRQACGTCLPHHAGDGDGRQSRPLARLGLPAFRRRPAASISMPG